MSVLRAKNDFLTFLGSIYNINVQYGFNEFSNQKCFIYVDNPVIRSFYSEDCTRQRYEITGELYILTTEPCKKELGFFTEKGKWFKHENGTLNLRNDESLLSDFISISFEYLSREYIVENEIIGNINDIELEVSQP